MSCLPESSAVMSCRAVSMRALSADGVLNALPLPPLPGEEADAEESCLRSDFAAAGGAALEPADEDEVELPELP